MQVKCDGDKGCGQEFQLNDFMIEKIKADIERTFFSCPHCGKEYTGYYTNIKIRSKQQKMRDLQERYNRARTVKDLRQAEIQYNRMESLKKEIKADMKSLRSRIEG